LHKIYTVHTIAAWNSDTPINNCDYRTLYYKKQSFSLMHDYFSTTHLYCITEMLRKSGGIADIADSLIMIQFT